MVSSTLCPAVHILGSQNVYGRAEGIADHYWPWAVFFAYISAPRMKFKNRLGAPESIHMRGLVPKNEPIRPGRLGCRGGATDFDDFHLIFRSFLYDYSIYSIQFIILTIIATSPFNSLIV